LELKYCWACVEDLPISEFTIDTYNPSGIRNVCKGCRLEHNRIHRTEYQKQYYIDNRELRIEYQKQYYIDNIKGGVNG
jgi:hypothetical protein